MEIIMSRIKLIVTDLDFTALRNDRTISQHTADVFRRCSNYGIRTAIATARFFFGARPFMEQLRTDYAITNDGTMVYRGQEFWFGTSLGYERTAFLIEKLVAADPAIRLSVSTRQGVFRNFSQVDYLTAPYTSFDVVDFTRPFLQDAFKIVAEPTAPELLPAIALAAGCKVLRYRGENRYTFLLENTGKAAALRSLAARLGLDLSEVAAFGDDTNDLGMLRTAGLGIAVRNALPEVQKAAADIARSNEDDGVARYIEEHFF